MHLREFPVMNRGLLVIFALVTVAMASVGSACLAKDPCGEGLHELPDYRCAPLPTPPDAGRAEASVNEASVDGGGGEAGEASAPAVASGFGQTCAKMADCPSDAPICPAPKLPYCTQIDCEPGEANAGVCPAGFTCVRLPGLPSGCLKD